MDYQVCGFMPAGSIPAYPINEWLLYLYRARARAVDALYGILS